MCNVGVEIVGAIGRRPGRRVSGITGVSTDSRSVRPGELFFALTGARVDGHDFVADVLRKDAAAAVVQRDVAVPPEFQDRVIRVPDTLRALADSARAWRREWGGLVIGITGSNGKTTTREMVYHLLSDKLPCKRSPKSFNTEVGVPLTLFTVEPTDRAVVVEMGTNAPGEIAELVRIAEPNLGVITCIAETHLEGLGSVEGVAQAKAELLAGLGPKGAAFLNADDPWFDFLAGRHAGKVVPFGVGARAIFRATEVQPEAAGSAFTLRGMRVRLRVPGRHNVLNALAALALADHLGLDLRDAAAAMESFRLPEMRLQMELIKGVTVVFDGYNANPGSMRAALETFRDVPASGRKVAVLGDMLELGARSAELHRTLGADVAGAGVDAVYAVGKFSREVADAAKAHAMRGLVTASEELNGIADEICRYVRPGDALLVKGSRGMKLEYLVEKLRATVSAGNS